MEPFHAIADLYSKRSLHGVAYSALPDAPVQPYVEPRRRLRRMVASIHRSARPSVIDLRPARYSTEC
ncbi:MAG: hypothetical protein ABI862_06535 [Ilumatobacteraceae bacterium]